MVQGIDRGSFHVADGVERETPELGPKPELKHDNQSMNQPAVRRSSRQGSYPTFYCSNPEMINESSSASKSAQISSSAAKVNQSSEQDESNQYSLVRDGNSDYVDQQQYPLSSFFKQKCIEEKNKISINQFQGGGLRAVRSDKMLNAEGQSLLTEKKNQADANPHQLNRVMTA